MKKVILVLVITGILATFSIYLFIPGNIAAEAALKVPCTPGAGFRVLQDEQRWNKWWPAQASKVSDSLVPAKRWRYHENNYSITQKAHNSFAILIDAGKYSVASQINFFSVPGDSSIIRWQAVVPAGNNPLNRLSTYAYAQSLKKDMAAILSNIQTYLSNFTNVYGSVFHEGSITDTFLISNKTRVASSPSTEIIYSRINKLKKYCSNGNCSVTGIPMINITHLADSSFQLMTALPVNRFMPSTDSVYAIKMVPGKFIITEIKGGPSAINETHRQLLYYFQDYNRTAMAIPFDYLVTDRLQERDTSRWITRIYSPVY